MLRRADNTNQIPHSNQLFVLDKVIMVEEFYF